MAIMTCLRRRIWEILIFSGCRPLATLPGCGLYGYARTGGVAMLNHRLFAGKPPASRGCTPPNGGRLAGFQSGRRCRTTEARVCKPVPTSVGVHCCGRGRPHSGGSVNRPSHRKTGKLSFLRRQCRYVVVMKICRALREEGAENMRNSGPRRVPETPPFRAAVGHSFRA
jgi:hypothetical protein